MALNQICLQRSSTSFLAVVSTPADYDIPYEELELKAADGVKIKAYLLLQKRIGNDAPHPPLRVAENEVSTSVSDEAPSNF
jgi:hypothetical protein